jgi:hypothetical protein
MSALAILHPRQFERFSGADSRDDLRSPSSGAVDDHFTNSVGIDQRPDLRLSEPGLVRYPRQMGTAGRVRIAAASVARGVGQSDAFERRGLNPQRDQANRDDLVHGESGGKLPVTSRMLPASTRRGWV